MKKLISSLVFSLCLLGANTAFADGPYEVVERDGVYYVERDGKVQMKRDGGTYHDTKESAEAHANRLNKKKKKEEESGDR